MNWGLENSSMGQILDFTVMYGVVLVATQIILTIVATIGFVFFGYWFVKTWSDMEKKF